MQCNNQRNIWAICASKILQPKIEKLAIQERTDVTYAWLGCRVGLNVVVHIPP